MKKIIAVIMAVSMLLALASCGSKPATDESTEPVSESEKVTEESLTSETEESSTEAQSKDDAESTDASETETSGEAETSEAETEKPALPSTTAEILAAYTAVMNQAKKDAPAFNKVEYQVLPDDSNSRVVSKGGTVVNAALKVAANFMVTEKDAKADPEIKEKGNNMRSWPVCKTPMGCMLTDTSAIKSAKCEELSNGNYKITIVLKDEANPEPTPDGGTVSPSKHGAVFSPLSKKEIDETLQGGIVSAVAKEISYNLIYHDCTAVLVYDPSNNHVVSLDQTMRVTISGQGKVVGIQMVVDKQELIDYMEIYNIKY